MRIILLLLFFCTTTFLFSQNKEMSYYFDSCIEFDLKNYSTNLFARINYFRNTKDSTYSMSLFQKKDTIYASLYDRKKNILVKFNVDSKYSGVEDLKKFHNSRLYNYVGYTKGKKYKNHVESFEYEYDSIKNQTLVHIIHYKNSKRKKIINEHYYYFSTKENIISLDKNDVKNYIMKNHNIPEIQNQNLEKTICVVNGKKQSESETVKITKIDYTFSFTPDQVYPQHKVYNNTTRPNIYLTQ